MNKIDARTLLTAAATKLSLPIGATSRIIGFREMFEQQRQDDDGGEQRGGQVGQAKIAIHAPM